MRKTASLLLFAFAASTATAAPFKPSEPELTWAVNVAWGEMRGQSDMEIAGVCHVMLNRLMLRRWGGTLEGVVRADRQFSALNVGDPNRAKLLDPKVSRRGSWKRVNRICRLTIAGRLKGFFDDPTNCADHYWTSATSPWWYRSERITKIGVVRFVRKSRCAAPPATSKDPIGDLIREVSDVER